MQTGEKDIHVIVKAELEDILATLLRQRRTVFVVLGLLFAVMCVCFVAFMIVALADETGQRSLTSALPFVTAMPFIVFLGFIEYRKARKQAAHLFETAEETKIHFTEKGVRTVSQHGQMDWEWSKIFKIKETAKDFLVLPRNNIGFPVMKRFFSNEEDISQLRSLILEKLGPKKAKLFKS